MDLWQNKNFEPMLLKEINKPFDSPDYLYELKYDGIRALIFVGPNTFIIKSRHNEQITQLYPELKNMQKYFKQNTILDGEIVIFKDNKPSFKDVQMRAHLKNKEKISYLAKTNPVHFVCFDILYLNANLVEKDLLTRKKYLEKIKNNPYLTKTFYIENKGINLFKNVKKEHLEGIVAKLKNSIYEINTRSDSWIKIKNWQREDFFIIGFNNNDNHVMFSAYLAEKINDNYSFVGKVSIPKKEKIYQQLQKIVTKKNYCDTNFKDINFVKPQLTCLVEYLEKTENNHLRQPIFRQK